jgi:hypothetical protein
MLRVTGMRDGTESERLYSVEEDGAAASVESLRHVARFGTHLLKENGLSGSFRVAGEGLLALDLSASERTFFHEGIVFAALDVQNNPVKNPTVTRLADPEE